MSRECCNIHCPKNRHVDDECESYEYSNHLKNWTEWQKKRMKLFHKLYKATGRKPGELISNYGEEFRKVQEERTRLEYTRINTSFDKYRGNPEFWVLPTKLKDKGYEDPQYFAFRTLPDKNIIPPITRVATPEFALKEKKIFPLVRSIFTKWSSSKYRQQQLKVLSNKLREVEPHIPHPSSLFVFGERVLEESVQKAIDESVRSSKSSLDRFFGTCFDLNEIRRLSLNVHDVNVISTDDVSVTCPKIRYFFHYSDFKTPIKETLTLQNNGRVTVRITWQKIDRFFMFKDATNMNIVPDSCFYFGKQEILVRPGQTEEIPLWFLPKRPGIYTEKWTMHTVPKIAEESTDLIIFQSVTEDKQYKKSEQRIKETIEIGVRNSMIKECLSDLMDEFRYAETFAKICHVSQQQIFECRNLKEFFGLRKPAYTFNDNNIQKLRMFYSEIKQPNDPILEDLSIEDLKLLAKRADVIEYIKEHERIYARMNLVREKLDKNPRSQSCLNTDLIWGSEISLSNTKLKDILSEFEAPLMVSNKEREKHVIAFNVLRSYFIRMCKRLEENDGVEISDNYIPCVKLTVVEKNPPVRWMKEAFDEIWIPKSEFISPDSQSIPMFPKPKILETISPKDVEAVHRTYFTRMSRRSIEKSRPSLMSESSKCTENETVRASPLGMSLSSVGNIVRNGETIETHDLYLSKDFNYHRYILIYTTLQNAIDAMIDSIETFKMNFVEDNILEKVIESGQSEYFKKQKLDLKTYERIEEDSSDNCFDYFDYLLDLVFLKNENVTEYIVKCNLPNWEERQINTNIMKLDELVNLAIAKGEDKYEDLIL